MATLPLNGRPEAYTEWLRSFEGNLGVPALLEQLAGKGVDVKQVRALLYAAPLLGSIKARHDLDKLSEDLATAQRHLDSVLSLLEPYPFHPKQRIWTLGMLGCVGTQVEEQRKLLAEWRSAFSTVQVTDLVIAMVARDLKRAGSRKVNEQIATLLTAAAVPGGTRDEVTNGWAWDAATVHKRRDRMKRNPVAVFGPYRHLFKNVNLQKLAQKYPALFVESSIKGTPEAQDSGQKLAAARAHLLSYFERPAAQEDSGTPSSASLAGPSS